MEPIRLTGGIIIAPAPSANELHVLHHGIASEQASHVHHAIVVRASGVHNRGVFAKCHIPEDTVIGSYPGFPKTGAEMFSKAMQYPNSQGYCFTADNGMYLDPTDSRGQIEHSKLWGLADRTLAFVNEPPVGLRTNVGLKEGKGALDILYVTVREIEAFEELYVDYGLKYDRTNYRD